MRKTEFQYELANIDMKDLYTEMLCYGENWPEVIVVKEIEDGSKVLRRKMVNGNDLIYLKNNENMFDTLCKELEMHEAKVVPAMPFENHNLSNEELMTWISCACEIADLLDIRCPQIIFTPFKDAGNASGQGMLSLPDTKPYGKLNIVEMFVCIAHELRHEWQHENHPEWFDEYVQVESDEDMDAYLNHKTEIDAETYARKLAGMVFDLQLLVHENPKLMDKLINRANEIDIPISEDIIEFFMSIFDVEDWEDLWRTESTIHRP